MPSGVDPKRASVKDKDGKHALWVARSLRLLRAARLALTSVGQVAGQSRTFDGDMRMVRMAAEAMEQLAHEEGVKL